MTEKNITNITGDRVLRTVYDEDGDAIRTKLVNAMEFSVELDHEDGDSVFAIKRSKMVAANDIVSCAGFSKLGVFVSGKIYLSPHDEGDFFVEKQVEAGQVIEICARRLKSEYDCVIQG
ncbi:MAG: hypothetical protein ABIM30_01155 [candidate division WOR-3 bacterium]